MVLIKSRAKIHKISKTSQKFPPLKSKEQYAILTSRYAERVKREAAIIKTNPQPNQSCKINFSIKSKRTSYLQDTNPFLISYLQITGIIKTNIDRYYSKTSLFLTLFKANKVSALFFIILFWSLIFITVSKADSPRSIPPRPCDFYGREEKPSALRTGSVITAKDPNGIILGRFIIIEPGKYGFLTCVGDDPNTPQDEGAVVGDIITFFIAGVSQQKQAVWKQGEAISVNLGITQEETGAFNLHLTGMPGYSNYQGNPDFSGVAVSDMIQDYLNPDNIDTQADLMLDADQNNDGETSGSEIQRLLNAKSPSVYNFGTTSTLNSYSSLGKIDSFDAGKQNDCVRQLCHWMAYKVPKAPAGKEYVPVAIAASSNPAISADSNYKHWMSVVGIKTNHDPFPNLADNAAFRDKYHVPETLELYGVYLNDPGVEGLGFHSYISAEVWLRDYFRPIAAGLEEAGKYAAIMEPPDSNAAPVYISPAPANNALEVILKIPQSGVSIFVPSLIDPKLKVYLSGLLGNLRKSADFATLINDGYFGQSLKDTIVHRCFKVDAAVNNAYTIIPFEKQIQDKLITTSAVIVNNETGQFQMAAADPKSSAIYSPMSLADADKALRKKIGWRNEYPINFWLSNSVGSPLFPGWSVVTLKYYRQGPVNVLNTTEYTITPEKEVKEEKKSAQVEILSNWSFKSGKNWVKIVLFSITDTGGYSVFIDNKQGCKECSLTNNKDKWMIVLRGSRDANCRIKIQTAGSKRSILAGGVTYIYAGK